jgi:hypothetical protein
MAATYVAAAFQHGNEKSKRVKLVGLAYRRQHVDEKRSLGGGSHPELAGRVELQQLELERRLHWFGNLPLLRQQHLR